MYHSFPGGRRAVARRTSSDRLEGAWLSFIEAQIRFLPSDSSLFLSHIPHPVLTFRICLTYIFFISREGSGIRYDVVS